MTIKQLGLGPFLVLTAACIAFDAVAQVRTFDSPQHEGFAVSYCGADSTSCGEYVATAWCVTIGYEYATDWAARRGSESALAAVSLDDGAICDGPACESFARITCGPDTQRFTTPVLGPAGDLALLSANRRSVEQAVDATQYRVLVPGCSQHQPGVFVCGSIDEYQHCRTLMISRMIHSCRADLAFRGVDTRPSFVDAAELAVEIESDAVVRVSPGYRGVGQVKGNARVSVAFDLPSLPAGAKCQDRRPYTYLPTGPEGGVGTLGKADDCDAPVELKLEAHADDLLRAFDLCETFAAWGLEIEDSMEAVIGSVFRIGADGGSVRQLPVAPYSLVSAPLTIECSN